jgi:hypothetical protein
MTQETKTNEAAAQAIEAIAAKYAPQGSVIAARFELQRREIAEQVREASEVRS